MGLLELPDLRHTLVDMGTSLLCISGYNGLPDRTLPINLINETAPRSERVDNAALSCKCCFIRNTGPNDVKGPFLHVLKIASKILTRQVSKDSGS